MEFKFYEHTIAFAIIKPNDWSIVTPIKIQEYPWYESGKKQDTQIFLAHNGQTLWLHILASDNYSFASRTELNTDVCNDSCVEFFFSPRKERDSIYFNAEVNCIGTPHLAYGPDRNTRTLSTPQQAASLNVEPQIKATSKIETPYDESWSVDFEINLEMIQSWSGEELSLSDYWWANFFRCGGNIEPQYASWNPIITENPDYHRPDQFGKLIFAPQS